MSGKFTDRCKVRKCKSKGQKDSWNFVTFPEHQKMIGYNRGYCHRQEPVELLPWTDAEEPLAQSCQIIMLQQPWQKYWGK